MDANSGIAAIQAAAAKKRNAGGNIAGKLGKNPAAGNKSSPARNDAIKRRLAKGSSDNLVNDNDADDN
jgi:hypothetical protein